MARAETRSMALVLTLVTLVIVSALTVGFFASASHDLQATKSYDSSVNVEKITLGGIAQVLAQMRAQATDLTFSTTNGTGTNILYIPLSGARALPQHMVTNTGLPTLLTVSGLPVYQAGSGTEGTNLASPCATTNASLNHRSVSRGTWLEPELIATTNSSNLPIPQWVLMTRNGPTVFSSYNSDLGSSALGNADYVLGRYAYAVYDVSGLIDINAAGYPSMASNGASFKGLAPWADLTQLGVATSDVDTLVQWRNAGNAANYAAYVTNWATNGFMQVAPGDTTFLGRQELIKYAQQPGHTAWTNALPYLTTFSREFNGPTWKPSTNLATPYDYITHEYKPTTSGSTNDNVFILNPRVVTSFTRANGSTASVGEPLVKYRFPLAKLALLEKQGTTVSALSSQDQKTVAQYFGLDLVSDSSGLYRHWSYPTANTSYPHTPGRILTLDEVAALVPAREPDFFELLQAGILQGSVGYVPTYNYPANTKASVRGDFRLNAGISATRPDPDDSITYQILRIGANLIDQWDADSYPTTVTFNLGGGTTQDFYGVEDLPYINELFMKAYGDGVKGYTVYAYCELWNPHANAVTNAGLYPTSFRILPLASGNVATADSYMLQFIGKVASTDSGFGIWAYNGTTFSAANDKQYLGAITNGGAIPFTTTPATSYREPALIGGNPVGPPSGSSISTPVWSQASSIGAWVLGSLPIPSANTADTGSSGSGFPTKWSQVGSYQLNYPFDMILPIQFQDQKGNYHTYSTFMGLANSSLNTGYTASAYNSAPASEDTSYNAWSFPKSDPRTYRYGSMGTFTPAAGVPYTNSANVGLTPALCNSAATLDSPTYINPPFYGPANNLSTLQNYRLDLWTVNDPAVTPVGPTPASPNTNSYYPDSDGIYRPGDARYSYPTQSPLYVGASANRPLILNRPFQSVGDLGYAFRDAPWKTLDFFSSNSADAALLDLFSIDGGMVSAGKVNPNTPYPQVLTALISGALQGAAANTTVSSANASSVAAALVSESGATPFLNRADLVGSAMGNVGAKISNIKSEREAVIRALADSANLRTWNLLIDVVGQAGQYPSTASSLNDFVVTGQRRYWLHVAIDRYTGAIIDQQLEVVSE